MSLGVDTAMNTAIVAIDRIKDTATSHRRAFLVETMGRDSGYLALMVGMASAAEAIIIPEVPASCETILSMIKEAHGKGKAHFIAVVAEGATPDCQTIEELAHGRHGTMTGLVGSRVVATDLEKVLARPREVDLSLYELAQRLEIYPEP
jgi:6-phosphofructokinase